MGRLITSTYPLTESASVILNASGTGVAYIGPKNQNQIWKVRSVAVSVGSATDEPVAKVYMNSVGQSNFLSGSYSGSQDTNDLGYEITLRPGTRFAVEWTGGDAGARATVTVYGTVEVGR